MNKHTTAMASRMKAKGKIKEMKIKPVDHGGFISEVHYHPNEDSKNNMMMTTPEPDTAVHTTLASVKSHLGNTFAPNSSEATQPTSQPGAMDTSEVV